MSQPSRSLLESLTESHISVWVLLRRWSWPESPGLGPSPLALPFPAWHHIHLFCDCLWSFSSFLSHYPPFSAVSSQMVSPKNKRKKGEKLELVLGVDVCFLITLHTASSAVMLVLETGRVFQHD